MERYREKLQRIYTARQREAPEASLLAPHDEAHTAQAQEAVAQLRTSSLRYVVVIGIGGSNLGTRAVYDALGGFHATQFPTQDSYNTPRMVFFDTVDAQALARGKALIDALQLPEEIVMVVVSKSGNTTETVFNAELLIAALTEKFGTAGKGRVVVISEDHSPLAEAARAAGVCVVPHPPMVGGRYSVFTAVGLVPLALAGCDIASLRRGAQEALMALEGEKEEDRAYQSAIFLFHAYQSGHRILDFFTFSPALESVGKWYRQLVGESLGKLHNVRGEVVEAGFTPTVSVGSTDLHSVGQLYLGGPKDKVTSFVTVEEEDGTAARIPSEEGRVFPTAVEMIADRSASDVSRAILMGIQGAYRERALPYCTWRLGARDAHTIGVLLQILMLQVMYVGALLEVNAFDQPHVERYKEIARQVLESRTSNDP